MSHIPENLASDATTENPFEPKDNGSSQCDDSGTNGAGPHSGSGDDDVQPEYFEEETSDEGKKKEWGVMCENSEDDDNGNEHDENSDNDETRACAPAVAEESNDSKHYDPITPKPMPMRRTSSQEKGKSVASSRGPTRSHQSKF